MIKLSSDSLETIDQLCKRDCAFALYRFPHSGEDHFCMQSDGGYLQHEHVGGLISCASFVMAPFLPTMPLLQIREESHQLPTDSARWSLLPTAAARGDASYPRYEDCFAQYHSIVDSCRPIQKLVLARSKDVRTTRFSPARAYIHATARNTRAFHVLIHSPLTGTWLSSTPELLLSGTAGDWQTQALAGTQVRGSSWTEKNRDEQSYVTLHCREVLRALGIDYRESAVETVYTERLQHLSTRFTLQMAETDILPLLARLAPTPAVAGYPCLDAKLHMTQHPDLNRAYYSGYLGRYAPQESTALYVCLRCMQIYPDYCRLYAGGGIMSESSLQDEYNETEQKMRPMLELIQLSEAEQEPIHHKPSIGKTDAQTT